MRRSLVRCSVLLSSAAFAGACDPSISGTIDSQEFAPFQSAVYSGDGGFVTFFQTGDKCSEFVDAADSLSDKLESIKEDALSAGTVDELEALKSRISSAQGDAFSAVFPEDLWTLSVSFPTSGGDGLDVPDDASITLIKGSLVDFMVAASGEVSVSGDRESVRIKFNTDKWTLKDGNEVSSDNSFSGSASTCVEEPDPENTPEEVIAIIDGRIAQLGETSLCEYANDGECDEPGLCAPGTDGNDCP